MSGLAESHVDVWTRPQLFHQLSRPTPTGLDANMLALMPDADTP